MLSADKINEVIKLSKYDLIRVLARSGYTGCSFKDSEFVGLTTGGQFCYRVDYWDDGGGPEEELVTGKVFVWYGSDGRLVADY